VEVRETTWCHWLHLILILCWIILKPRSLQGRVHRAPDEPTAELCWSSLQTPGSLTKQSLAAFFDLHQWEALEDRETISRERFACRRNLVHRRSEARKTTPNCEKLTK
jgi:hypothetical protein